MNCLLDGETAYTHGPTRGAYTNTRTHTHSVESPRAASEIVSVCMSCAKSFGFSLASGVLCFRRGAFAAEQRRQPTRPGRRRSRHRRLPQRAEKERERGCSPSSRSDGSGRDGHDRASSIQTNFSVFTSLPASRCTRCLAGLPLNQHIGRPELPGAELCGQCSSWHLTPTRAGAFRRADKTAQRATLPHVQAHLGKINTETP